jgi:hypothetical protein
VAANQEDMKQRPQPVVPREEAKPEGEESERHHAPSKEDGDDILHNGERTLAHFQRFEVRPHD